MFTFRFATPDDAEAVAAIISETSAGVVEYLFDKLIPGLDGDKILSAALMKNEAPYNSDNIILSEKAGQITSLLFSYPASEHFVPQLMESFIPQKRINPVRPILEKSVPNSLYINTIWLTEKLRGNGHASAIIVEAKSRCRRLGLNGISLFCWNDNERALHFYAKQGFSIIEHLPPEELSIPGHTCGGSILWKQLKKD